MQDKSLTNLCIMGPSEEVKKVKAALSDELDCFNPFRVYACEEIITQQRSFITPGNGESLEEFKKRMLCRYQEFKFSDKTGRLYRCHYGPAMNPSDFPGISKITKEICSFMRTFSTPISEFSTISQFYDKVSFSIKTDSSSMSHAGSVYIHQGIIFYENHLMHLKDKNGFDISLDDNFEFRYLTKYKKLGMLVPPEKLLSIENIFVPVNPDEIKYTYSYFPYFYDDFELDHIPYIPKLYKPTEEEIEMYWDTTIAEVINLERVTILYNK